MNQKANKRIIAGVLTVLLADIVLGYLFFSSRALSHLAAWNVKDSAKKEDFYWAPDQAPAYFRFEPGSEETPAFENDARSAIGGAEKGLPAVLALGRRVRGLGVDGPTHKDRVKWDSPQEMLRQVKEGARANCFHRSILLSSYAASAGLPSRLWVLENVIFDGTAHTVSEVYVSSMQKWVFLDVLFGFYATANEDGLPLSFLEFRERLLGAGAGRFTLRGFDGEVMGRKLPAGYKKLVTCAFLRARSDFRGQYRARYGPLFAFRRWLDKLPNGLRVGLGYFLSDTDIFLHYEDRFSPGLRFEALQVKALFYLFVFLTAGLVIEAGLFLANAVLFRRRSRKETRHT